MSLLYCILIKLLENSTNVYCCSREPVDCGSTIRLQHLTTKKYLHSHLFSSPLSGNQEVSAFGENGIVYRIILISIIITISTPGVGDTGDHWKVVCDADFWERDDSVVLKHVDSGAFLGCSGILLTFFYILNSIKPYLFNRACLWSANQRATRNRRSVKARFNLQLANC